MGQLSASAISALRCNLSLRDRSAVLMCWDPCSAGLQALYLPIHRYRGYSSHETDGDGQQLHQPTVNQTER